MKFLFKLVKPLLKRIVKKKLKSEAYKSAIVEDVNDLIDLPNLNEQEEAELLDSIYNSLAKALLKMIDRM